VAKSRLDAQRKKRRVVNPETKVKHNRDGRVKQFPGDRVGHPKSVFLDAFPRNPTGPRQEAGMDDNKKGWEILERAKSKKRTEPRECGNSPGNRQPKE